MCREGRVDDARELLNRLPSYGFQSDTVSYTTLLKGLCTSKRWDDVEQMTEHGCATNTTLCNIVINSICKQGRVDDAFKLLNDMGSYGCNPDTISYTTVLKGLCRAERWDDAKELLNEMVRNNCPPNEVTFNTFICILCQKGLIEQAIMLIEQMSEHGCIVGVVTYNALCQWILCARPY